MTIVVTGTSLLVKAGSLGLTLGSVLTGKTMFTLLQYY